MWSGDSLPVSELQHFLICLVAVDSILELRRREAKATYSWFRGATVRSRGGDGIPHASVSQPACFTVVQAPELPGGIELSHPGHLCASLLTRLLSLCQVHPLRLLKEEDFSCWETIYLNLYIHCSCTSHLHKQIKTLEKPPMITVKYLLHHLMRQTLIAGFMCLLWPPHLWVKGRSRRHHIDGGADDVFRSYGPLEGDGHPHMAPWAWWWGSARFHLLAILHCTSLSLPSKTGRAVWGWPGWHPVPHTLAGLPGSSNGNDHEGAGKETPHLGGKLLQVGLVSAIT